MPRLNVCPNEDCQHYAWNHGEFGCKTIGCDCKATGLALKLAEEDRMRFVENSGVTAHKLYKAEARWWASDYKSLGGK